MDTLLAVAFLPENFIIGAIGSMIFGFLGILLLLLGFKLFDWMLPAIDFQVLLNTSPIATSVVIAAFFLSLALIISSVLH